MTSDSQPSLFDEVIDDVLETESESGQWDDLDHDQELDELVEQEDNSATIVAETVVEIIRSKNRKRSVSAKRVEGKTLVYVPARMSKADVDIYVAELVAKLDKREEQSASQEQLAIRAQQISVKYLGTDVFKTHKVPVTVRWVTNQNSRWGSCTPSEGTIRLSHRLQSMPQYVIDCVLLHELAHLLVADHGPKFKALIARHPEYARASAFLDGYSHAKNI